MNIHPGYTQAMASTSHQPLPLPWTEHVAPTGYLYYYNQITAESTYNRPISLSFTNVGKPKKRKKEKPAKKMRVEESSWFRVLTNRGNVFYFNEESRESIWDIPEDIAAAVEAMELEVEDDTTHGVKRKDREEDEDRSTKRMKREDPIETEDDNQMEDVDEEEWQRQLAEEMAEKPDESMEVQAEPVPEPVPTMPLEEATQLFKVHAILASNLCLTSPIDHPPRSANKPHAPLGEYSPTTIFLARLCPSGIISSRFGTARYFRRIL